jgi:oligoendopeptidase F
VLCTFTGTLKNVETVAHELGHAYHGRVLNAATFSGTYTLNQRLIGAGF